MEVYWNPEAWALPSLTGSGYEVFSSVAQLCPTLCDPMNCSMPGLPIHHQLPEFTQTHPFQVQWMDVGFFINSFN